MDSDSDDSSLCEETCYMELAREQAESRRLWDTVRRLKRVVNLLVDMYVTHDDTIVRGLVNMILADD